MQEDRFIDRLRQEQDIGSAKAPTKPPNPVMGDIYHTARAGQVSKCFKCFRCFRCFRRFKCFKRFTATLSPPRNETPSRLKVAHFAKWNDLSPQPTLYQQVNPFHFVHFNAKSGTIPGIRRQKVGKYGTPGEPSGEKCSKAVRSYNLMNAHGLTNKPTAYANIRRFFRNQWVSIAGFDSDKEKRQVVGLPRPGDRVGGGGEDRTPDLGVMNPAL